jgi:mono/diheme cytochrome c family protein
MPYPSYSYMSDADALAIMAYLFSLKPVHAPATPNSLSFPFNQRWLMSFWSAMFNADRRFEPVVDRGADWNRGAYLIEAMGHCGECHTPRNLFFALNNREKFTGAVQAGWRAYNITPDHASGIGAWSDTELAHYLSNGHADGRGTAAGPMGEAIDASLSHLQPRDIAAMVTYLRSVPSSASSGLAEPKMDPAPALQAGNAAEHEDARGKQVYEGACAGCHGWTGISPVVPFATLTGSRSINDPTGTNVAQVIIAGAQRHYASDPNNMPAFGSTYSDAEIASVANYVTARYGAKGSDLSAESVAKLRAAD